MMEKNPDPPVAPAMPRGPDVAEWSYATRRLAMGLILQFPELFSSPVDDGTPPVEGKHGSTDISVYSSFTARKGNNVLWHPDRKFYLVGKRITAESLAGLKVPAREQ